MNSSWRSATLTLLILALPGGAGWVTAQELKQLDLPTAARVALEAAPSVRAARSVVADAAGELKAARSAWYPAVGLDGSVFRHSDPMIVFPLHELSQTSLPVFDRTLWQGSLGLGYTLFEGGSRRQRVGQAEAVSGMAGDQLAGSEQQALAAVTGGFVEVLVARAVLEARDQQLGALAGEADRVARFLAEGRAARVEQLRVEAALAEARAERTSAVARLDVAELALARLLGVDPAQTRAERLVPVRLRAVPVPGRDSLAAMLRETNPSLRVAAGRITASQAARRVAAGSWFPSLRLEGRVITYAGSDYAPVTEWQTGLRLSYPLFTGGARSAQVERADARLAEAEARYREIELAALGRLDRSLASLREASERVAALRAAAAQRTEVVRVERLSLEQGAATQNDYLRAEADLAASRAGLAQAAGSELLARIELALVMGDLTLDSLPTLVENLP